MRPQTPKTPNRSLILAVVLLAGLAACGSGEDVGAASVPVGEASPTTGAGAEPSAPAAEESSGSSQAPTETTRADMPGAGTLTLPDGTVLEFETSVCGTSNTEPDRHRVDGYGINGETSDAAFKVSLGSSGPGTAETAVFEGDFDESGASGFFYLAQGAGALDLVVDGAHVSGVFTMSSAGSGTPYGDEVEVIADFRC